MDKDILNNKKFFLGVDKALSRCSILPAIHQNCQKLDLIRFENLLRETLREIHLRWDSVNEHKFEIFVNFVCSEKLANKLAVNFVDVITTDCLPDNIAYMLVLETSHTEEIFKPIVRKDYLSSISIGWDEYFNREESELAVIFPWLQVKFNNIQI